MPDRSLPRNSLTYRAWIPHSLTHQPPYPSVPCHRCYGETHSPYARVVRVRTSCCIPPSPAHSAAPARVNLRASCAASSRVRAADHHVQFPLSYACSQLLPFLGRLQAEVINPSNVLPASRGLHSALGTMTGERNPEARHASS